MIDLVAETPAGALLPALSNERLATAAAGGVPIVDIRRPYEWEATGVIPGSILLTFFDEAGGFDLEDWLEALAARLDPQQPFVLVCRLGRRTDILGRYLSGACNLAGAAHLEHGITWWIAEGRPVAAPDAG